MYAVIKTGGKQYRVQEGDTVFIEKLNAEVGDTVDFDVLMLQDGDETLIGTPVVEGAKVSGKVTGSGKGKKIIVFKFKAKKNYRRKSGHRQPFTKVEIVSIAKA